MTQSPYSTDLAPWDFWLFPKLKSPLKGKRLQTVGEIQENMMGQLMASGWTVWGSKVPTWKGTEASLSYIQCFLYLISSSINISIFHSTWLDTFWTDLVYLYKELLFTCLLFILLKLTGVGWFWRVWVYILFRISKCVHSLVTSHSQTFRWVPGPSPGSSVNGVETTEWMNESCFTYKVEKIFWNKTVYLETHFWSVDIL